MTRWSRPKDIYLIKLIIVIINIITEVLPYRIGAGGDGANDAAGADDAADNGGNRRLER